MAALDFILPFIREITIDDMPLVAQVASRNQTITTIQAAIKVWQFNLDVITPPLGYAANRAFFEDIRAINTSMPFSFTLAGAPTRLLSQYAYQGSLTPQEIAAVIVASQPTAGTQVLGLEGLPSGATNVFRKGDFIQVGNAVRTVTANVNATGTTASVPLSEALIAYPAIGTNIVVGTDVVWNNCYFMPDGYPKFGVSSEYGTPGTMTSTGGNFRFVQTRS